MNSDNETTSKISEVRNNIIELSEFILLNSKLRGFINDLLSQYSQNKIEKMDELSINIKNNLYQLSINKKRFDDKREKYNNQHVSNINSNLKDEFIKIYDIISKDQNEQMIKQEFGIKNNILKSFFKFLIQKEEVQEYLIDILKEENFGLIKKNIDSYWNNHLKLKINIDNHSTFSPDSLLNFSAHCSKLGTILIQDSTRRCLILQVSNVFEIMLRIQDNPLIPVHLWAKINVCMFGESSKKSEFKMSKKLLNMKYPQTSNLSIDEKSKYLIFNKMTSFFEIILSNFLKHNGKKGVFLFFIWASSYKSLFKEKCGMCHKLLKFNHLEKTFFPPYYKRYEILESSKNNNIESVTYHEDCFEWLNNSSL